MTLNNVEAIFKDLASRHKQINSFYNQQAFDITSVDEVSYPSLVINTSNISLPKGDGGYSSKSYAIDLQVIDLVHKDESNKQEILSDVDGILNDIVGEFNSHPSYNEIGLDLVGDVTLNPLRNAYGDEVSGWSTLLTLEAPNKISWCGSPLLALDGFTPTNNSVTITDNLNPSSPITKYAGDTYTCEVADVISINVSNSDDSYTVDTTTNLELPNVTHTDSDGTLVTLPALTPFVATLCIIDIFNPSDLNPYIWLDAKDEDLGLLNVWNNKGTSNIDATQSNSSLQPTVVDLNSNKSTYYQTSSKFTNLQHSGTGFINSNNNTGGFEVWTMMKLENGRQGTSVYFGARSPSNLYFQYFHGGSGKGRWFLSDTSSSFSRAMTENSIFPVGQTEWTLIRLVHNAANNQMEIHANGVNMTLSASENGSTAAQDFTQYNPSLDFYLNGRNNNGSHDGAGDGLSIGDFMVFNRLLTETEADDLTNYFI